MSWIGMCALLVLYSPPLQTVAQETLPAAVRFENLPIPSRGEPLADTGVRGKGAAIVQWIYVGAPVDGLDALSAMISPTSFAGGDSKHVYWAFDASFTHGQQFYMGLQPNGDMGGKMALFSFFGPGTQSDSPARKEGADGGPGMSCHIRYDWTPGHRYEFTARLMRETAERTTWEGAVTELDMLKRTVIGEVSVPRSLGYLSPRGAINFSELYARTIACAQQPGSEVLFFRPVGYRNGRSYVGRLAAVRENTECNPRFFEAGADAVYVDVGTGQ